MSKRKYSNTNYNAKKIAGICLIVVGAIAFLCSCVPSFLNIGKFFQGVFGITVYPLCLLAVFVGIAWLMGLRYTFSKKFTFYLIVAFISILALVHCIVSSGVLADKYTKIGDMGAYINSIYRMTNGISVGGILFSILVFALRCLVGIGGSYVVFAIIATVFIGLIVDYLIYSKARKQKKLEKAKPLTQNDSLKNVDSNSGFDPEEYSFSNNKKSSHVFEELEDEEPVFETKETAKNLFEADEDISFSFSNNQSEEEKTQNDERNNAKSVLFGSNKDVNYQNEQDNRAQEEPKSAHEILFGSKPKVPNIYEDSQEDRDNWRRQYASKTLSYDENENNNQINDNIAEDKDEADGEVIKTSWGEYRPTKTNNVREQRNENRNIFDRTDPIIPFSPRQESLNNDNSRMPNRRIDRAESNLSNEENSNGFNEENNDSIDRDRFSRLDRIDRSRSDRIDRARSDRLDANNLDRNDRLDRDKTSLSNFNRQAQENAEVSSRLSDRRSSSDILANASSLGIEMKPESNSFSSLLNNGRDNRRINEDRVKENPKPNFVGSTGPYVPPPTNILKVYTEDHVDYSEEYKQKSAILENTLANFKIPAKVINVVRGPKVTRYELSMPTGIPVTKILSYDRDISMNLATRSGVRIEAPIPGKNAFGVEVENDKSSTVGFRELVESPEFKNFKAPLAVAVGKNISGEVIIKSLAKMVHMLVAGSTGSGKSVFLHSVIMSLMYKYSPEELRFIMIDPKRVEFSRYNHMPHMILPEIVNECSKAVNALGWAVKEMERRYDLLEKNRCQKLDQFNECPAVKNGEEKKLPYIVIIIDELAELMGVAKKDVEGKIQRITQLGRAAGIHMVVATQRPSVDVITGVIKNNLPTRVALSLASATDSMTVINQGGAEKLLGWGDMLLSAQDSNQIVRLQGAFVSDEEIEKALDFIKAHNESVYDEEIQKTIYAEPEKNESDDEDDGSASSEERMDELMPQALKLVMKNGKASISMIQRRFSVGYARAARIIDQMETRNFIDGGIGNKPRDVKITVEEYNQLFGDFDGE